jgi:hypothetical protein
MLKSSATSGDLYFYPTACDTVKLPFVFSHCSNPSEPQPLMGLLSTDAGTNVVGLEHSQPQRMLYPIRIAIQSRSLAEVIAVEEVYVVSLIGDVSEGRKRGELTEIHRKWRSLILSAVQDQGCFELSATFSWCSQTLCCAKGGGSLHQRDLFWVRPRSYLYL